MGLRTRRLLFFYVVIFLWGTGTGVLTPVLPLYIRSLGFSIQDWGSLVMVYSVSTFLFEWLWGMLCDRYDRRFFIGAGLLSASVLVFMYSLSTSLAFLVLLQFVRGALFMMVGPAVKALVSDLSSAGSLGLSMGLYTAVRTVGGVVGPVLGSYVVESYSYSYALYTYSAVMLSGALLTLFVSRVGRTEDVPTDARGRAVGEGWRRLFRREMLGVLLVLPVIIFVERAAVSAYLPLYASERLGMSTLEVGALFSVGNVAGLVATPVFGWLSDRIGRRGITVAGFMLTTVMLVFLSMAASPSALTLSVIGLYASVAPLTPLTLAILMESVPRSVRGRAIGIYSTFENLGTAIAPPIYSLIWVAYAPSMIFLFAALVQVLGGFVVLVSSQMRSPKTRIDSSQ